MQMILLQMIPLLIINLNFNSLLIKFPIKQQNQNLDLINNDLNEKINNKKSNLERYESEDVDLQNNKPQFFCLELISVLIKYSTDIIENDKSLPCNKHIRIQSPENKIYIINENNQKNSTENISYNCFSLFSEIKYNYRKENIIHLLNNSFSFVTEIEYNYKIHKEIFIPQKKYSFYYIIPDDVILNLTFDQIKMILDIIIDIKNYFHESKLTYFTYCYLSEPEIYTTVKTLFLEICGHIQQKIIIRLEEFFEIIIKKVDFSYNDLSQEKNNQEINLIFTLVIKYFNKKINEYELFLEPYNFKLTAMNNSIKLCSNEKTIISQNKRTEEIENKDTIILNQLKKGDESKIDNHCSDKLSTNNSEDINDEENVLMKYNNPYGLSLNITVELLYIINNIYDIFMLYKKCHVLQNIQEQNSTDKYSNNKILTIFFYNYTNEIIQINQKYEIIPGDFLKFKMIKEITKYMK